MGRAHRAAPLVTRQAQARRVTGSQEIRADGWQHDVAALRRQVADQQHEIQRLTIRLAAAETERERIPPTDQNIRAVAHNALAEALTEWMRLSDRVSVSEAVTGAIEPLIRGAERERIRQLAIEQRATCQAGSEPPYTRPFAELLDAP